MGLQECVMVHRTTGSAGLSRLAYPLKDAAHMTGLSVRSLRYLIQTGRLGYARIGRRILIRHRDLEALLKRGYVKADTPLDADGFIRPEAGEAKRCGITQDRTAPRRDPWGA
jgi:excisionase family DNA binding protein